MLIFEVNAYPINCISCSFLVLAYRCKYFSRVALGDFDKHFEEC